MALIPQAVVVVTDDSSHNAFPGLARCPNGDLLVAYRTGSGHISTPASIVTKRSTDDGATWGAASAVVTAGDNRDPMLFVDSGGVLWLSYFVTGSGVYVVSSADSGATWGTPVAVSTGYTTFAAVSAPVYEVGGDLFLPVYGDDGGDEYAVLCRSTDGGATWSRYVVMAQASGTNYQEPNVAVLTGGTLLAVHRTSAGTLYTSTSTDSGATWSTPAAAFAASGRPAVIQDASGDVLLAYRASSGSASRYAVSSDSGATWSTGKDLSHIEETYVYAQWVAEPDGTVLVAWAEESGSDGDIYFRALTPSVGGTSSAYRNAVLADTPVGYWKLDETTGTTAEDSSGNARHGTYEGGAVLGLPSLPPAAAGNAAGFDGTNDRVLVPDNTAWETTNGGSLTVECWVQLDNPDANKQQPIVDKTGNTNNNHQWGLYYDNRSVTGSGRRLLFHVGGSGGFQSVEWAGSAAAAALAAGGHLVARKAVNVLSLWWNGALVAQQTVSPGGITGNTLGLGIGALATGVDWLDGTVDEVAVYQYGLPAERILAHYQAGAFEHLLPGSAASHASAVGSVVVGLVPAAGSGSGQSGAVAAVSVLNAAVTNNRVGGRWRSGSGTASWSPAVIAPPVGTSVDAAIAFSAPVVDEDTGRVAYTATKVEAPRHLDRIIVGNKDVTVWRGAVTPLPPYMHGEPLGFGPATLTLPQVHAAFEQPGLGALKFLRLGSVVKVQRLDPETLEVVAEDYRGVIVSHDHSGADFSCQVGGEAMGRAALRQKQVPIFMWKKDLGRMAHDAIRGLGLRFLPYLGPETGVRVQRFGGMGFLEYVQQVCAMAWTRGGNQWTIMPGEDGVYRMARKDSTTIHGTVYLDDTRAVGSLVRDLSEEPNRLYMTGVTPEGLRVRFGAYPGLKHTDPPPYPFTDGRTFGAGTTDAETDTGDGITVLVNRLFITKYLDRIDLPGGYDADVTRAVKDLQKDAGLTRTGDVNKRTWRVLYDLNSTGFSLRGSHILPAAERDKVKPWNLSPSGARISRNPDYDRRVLKVDRNVDAGTGFERQQLREWARTEIEQAREDNYVGSIAFRTNALIAGQHNPGDPLTEADLMPARDLRAGMNLWLPLFAGGQVVHVSAVNVSAGGEVSVDVDTRARDAMEVWEVIARNRESRRSLRREWIREHRQSTQTKDSIAPWDEVGGILGDKVQVPGNQWVVFPVVAGQEGTIAQLRMNTNPNAEFVVAVFGKRIGPRRLRRLIGNPLTRKGSKRWESENVRDSLDATNFLLYIAGSNVEPCGYWPKTKTKKADDDASPAPLTGRWEDDAGFPYRCFPVGVVWVAMWADRDTVVPRGRIMWPQLEAAT